MLFFELFPVLVTIVALVVFVVLAVTNRNARDEELTRRFSVCGWFG